jgi:hypothetical protein
MNFMNFTGGALAAAASSEVLFSASFLSLSAGRAAMRTASSAPRAALDIAAALA